MPTGLTLDSCTGFLMTEITKLLRDLVALPSMNPMGRDLQGPGIFEHRVTNYLEAFFRQLGVPFERQTIAPLRENIIARCECPSAGRTYVFEAHQDTVPFDNMTIDPFGAVVPLPGRYSLQWPPRSSAHKPHGSMRRYTGLAP